MTIGIDIDDTMTNSSELIMEYAKKYFRSDDDDFINDILRSSKIDNQLESFYNEYLPEMISKYTLKDNVRDVIGRLKSNGHKIIIITARGYTIKKDLEKITHDYFERHDLSVDKMIFMARDKLDSCIENKVDLMIDDSITVLNNIRASGIRTLLFTSICNKNIQTDLDRVESWLELEKYINDLML